MIAEIGGERRLELVAGIGDEVAVELAGPARGGLVLDGDDDLALAVLDGPQMGAQIDVAAARQPELDGVGRAVLERRLDAVEEPPRPDRPDGELAAVRQSEELGGMTVGKADRAGGRDDDQADRQRIEQMPDLGPIGRRSPPGGRQRKAGGIGHRLIGCGGGEGRERRGGSAQRGCRQRAERVAGRDQHDRPGKACRQRGETCGNQALATHQFSETASFAAN